ncbi:META domain-containing protein [uncultured Draconibacterium sp.]|uniref:META domain-containing protein n=1 Tax=uncultured Draconibacterium sp. TaxID=1573823 RepID=UPI003217E5BD
MRNTFLLAIIILAISCSSTLQKNTFTYWINSYTVDCTGLTPMNCMLIQKGEKIIEGQWQNFYSKIEGFTYEPGFIYKLEVKEEKLQNIPADASSIKYTLVTILEKKEDTKYFLNGNWEVIKINGAAITSTVQKPQIAIDIAEMTINGTDGCNNYSGTVLTIDGGFIELGPLAATRKMCPEMAIPDRFNQAISKVKTFRTEKNKLYFMDTNGSVVLECSKTAEPMVLINDIWVVEFIRGESVSAAAPQIEIHSEQMQIMGTHGCNNFKGKLTRLTNTEIEIGPLAGTRMMCPDMTNADKFNAAINDVKSYEIHNLKLILFDAEGRRILQLRKTD